MPRSSWEIPRPKFTDDRIRIPRPPNQIISKAHNRWAECPVCTMPQLLVDTRKHHLQIVACNWCKNNVKVRVTNFGRIKVEGLLHG